MSEVASRVTLQVGRRSYSLLVDTQDKAFVERAAQLLTESMLEISSHSGNFLQDDLLIVSAALSVIGEALKESASLEKLLEDHTGIASR